MLLHFGCKHTFHSFSPCTFQLLQKLKFFTLFPACLAGINTSHTWKCGIFCISETKTCGMALHHCYYTILYAFISVHSSSLYENVCLWLRGHSRHIQTPCKKAVRTTASPFGMENYYRLRTLCKKTFVIINRNGVYQHVLCAPRHCISATFLLPSFRLFPQMQRVIM